MAARDVPLLCVHPKLAHHVLDRKVHIDVLVDVGSFKVQLHGDIKPLDFTTCIVRREVVQVHEVLVGVEWLVWRDDHFDQELQLWVRQVDFWMTHHTDQNRIIIPFEALIDQDSGPALLLQMSLFALKPTDFDLAVPRYHM